MILLLHLAPVPQFVFIAFFGTYMILSGRILAFTTALLLWSAAGHFNTDLQLGKYFEAVSKGKTS